ncbi:MAG: molybdenum cofactor biosynthesis protein MoaB [Armatimonadetes bacterium]|nr:molybdenum cofactor biosynthesis protein MoaB [Armatimonadota bacterium]
MGHEEHKDAARAISQVACAVLIVTDTRTEAEDKSGGLAKSLLLSEGHRVSSYALIPNDPSRILQQLDSFLSGEGELLLVSGGTGLGSRDLTIETVAPRLERELPGFGELFRYLSYKEIGSSAMLSRATAGTIGRKLIILLPGSHKAVELALTRLILPELRHLFREITR